VLEQARSTQHHRPRSPDEEERLVARIIELATQFGRYGYRRITALLRREGWKVNHKRVERNLAQGRIEVATETAEEGTIVVERWILCKTAT